MLLPTASTAFVLPHFQRGSLAVLPGGEQRKVEELREEDFLQCAAAGTELCISSCVVRGIQRSSHAGFASLRVCLREQDGQVSVEVLQEFPFFARHRGWVSCCPHRTCQLYQLPCQQLAVGDICMVWSPRRQGHDIHRAQQEPPGER
ncbi:ataxin-1-like [Oxyura jamaicensis]|uniref:ataxin-1-like n=1 Tax=Oxyura jamaicensis TaxID=8884 RepID=UPI0015A61E23|nr:ataxin-1-like [Oxyura jamaicensis]